MKLLFSFMLFVASAVLNAAPPAPNCTLELQKILESDLAKTNQNTNASTLYSCKCTGSKKEIDALLITERLDGSKEFIEARRKTRSFRSGM